jgi:hypothetical protein
LLAHVIEHRRQIGHPLFGQSCPCAGFPQLPMQFLGLDAQLPELTARTAQTARFDRTQYAVDLSMPVPDAASARVNEVVVFMYAVPLLNQ